MTISLTLLSRIIKQLQKHKNKNLKKLLTGLNLETLLNELSNVWLGELREEQHNYRKSKILNKDDGSDWKLTRI